MKKIRLDPSMRRAFEEFCFERKLKWDEHLHFTMERARAAFDWMVRHNLTVEENAKSYYTENGKRQIRCYGYSGPDVGTRDDEAGMIWNLFHEVWCFGEWVSRYDGAKDYIGARAFNEIRRGAA